MIPLSEKTSEAKRHLFIIFLLGGILGILDEDYGIGQFIGNGIGMMFVANMIGALISFIIRRIKFTAQRITEAEKPLDADFEKEVVVDKKVIAFHRIKWSVYVALFFLIINLVSRIY